MQKFSLKNVPDLEMAPKMYANASNKEVGGPLCIRLAHIVLRKLITMR